MNSNEHDTEDLQPRSVPSRSTSVPLHVAPFVPEVSLMLSNLPWLTTRTSRAPTSDTHGNSNNETTRTATASTSGNSPYETTVPGKRNVGRDEEHEALNRGTNQPAHHELKKLLHSSHKPNLNYFNCPDTPVIRSIEGEMFENSKRAYLARTSPNKSDTHNENQHINSHSCFKQQNNCAHDYSVNNRNQHRFPYLQNGSPKTNRSNESRFYKNNQNNRGHRSVWDEINDHKNFNGSAHHSKYSGDKYRMERNNHKKYYMDNSEGNQPSGTQNEIQNESYINKEPSSPLNCAPRQMKCWSADPLCIPQERIEDDYTGYKEERNEDDYTATRQERIGDHYAASKQDRIENGYMVSNRGSVEKGHKDIAISSAPNVPFSLLQQDDGGTASPSGPDLGLDSLLETRTLDKSGIGHVMSDLYSLVHSLNEQLKILQLQNDKLLLNQANSPAPTPTHSFLPVESVDIQSAKKHVTMVNVSTQTMVADNHTEIAVGTDSRPMVSIGVMTSFTSISDSPQPQETETMDRFQTRLSSRDGPIYHHCLAHAPESSENAHNDESIYINSKDLPAVHEQLPSPMSSIHVDMHDYEDDDCTVSAQQSEWCNEDYIPQREIEGADRFRWTFYNNTVGQRLDLPPDAGVRNNRCHAEQDNRRQYEDVKNATVDQLRKMGISFHNTHTIDAPAEFKRAQKFDSIHYPRLDMMPISIANSRSDTSIHINDLALKYLKKHEPSNVADGMQDMAFYNVEMKTTNISLGTMKYLERYNLLPFQDEASGGVAPIKEARNYGPKNGEEAWRGIGHGNGGRPPGIGPRGPENGGRLPGIGPRGGRDNGARVDVNVKVPYPQPQSSSNKILDITTLKKQPKLL